MAIASIRIQHNTNQQMFRATLCLGIGRWFQGIRPGFRDLGGCSFGGLGAYACWVGKDLRSGVQGFQVRACRIPKYPYWVLGP